LPGLAEGVTNFVSIEREKEKRRGNSSDHVSHLERVRTFAI